MKDQPPYLLKISKPWRLAGLMKMMVCVLLALSVPRPGFAGGDPAPPGSDHVSPGGDPAPPFEEILVLMNVQGVGGVQIPAAIRNDVAYLAVSDVLDYLKIKNTVSPGMDSITGFFILQQAVFLIDPAHNQIIYQGRKFELEPNAIIRTATDLYLRADYFGLVFGLNCKFNFRTLSVLLTTSLDLPVIREIRQEEIRTNLNRLRGEAKVDTTIGRSYPLFRLGMADWGVVATQGTQQGLPEQDDNRLFLALGGVVAGGETNVALNYDNHTPFVGSQQFFQWRYVDNDNPGLRQVTAGKIYTPSIASIYAPVIGLLFTNAPTVYRRSFGTYTLTYYSEANWVVELYINNSLVNYAKAPAAGVYTFKVPLVYGNSLLKLRFYGPWGEEISHEQNIQIPFNFLPVGEFEYTASAGIVQDSVNSRFGRVSCNYGLGERLTVGAGAEYLSSIANGRNIPFVNASLRLSSNLLLSGEYALGVRAKFVASYHLPSDLQLELNYIRYTRGQEAINYSYLEERKAIVSFPFRRKKFTLFSRLSLYQAILPATELTPASKYTTGEGLLSGVFFGVNTNLTTYAWFTQQSAPYVYSSLSMAFRLPARIILTPQVQYEYSQRRISDLRAEMGKYLSSRGFFNVYYEKNIKSNFTSVGVGLRYNFAFTLPSMSFTRVDHAVAMVQSASGSVIYDDRTKYVGYDNHSAVGKGGLLIEPYLDLNGNGKRDPGEPRVSGVTIRINGGVIQYHSADTTIRVSGLEAYASYTLHLDASFESIAWEIRNKTIRVVIDPNQFKVLEVPVAIFGEVTGMVYLKGDSSRKPLGRIVVCFYRSDKSPAGQAISEADGSFDFAGLAPGEYTAEVSAGQLERLHMSCRPWTLPFKIAANKNGDVAEGLEFILQSH
jgi:hypothetical protein